ncbi:hypothetical protein [Rickettsia montanensis]|uniref:Uncharacterized protein n=1 Tax=Rickettsia montanensis (strain OSU 85-930) TaxID=1105114 RepID=H8KA80_RICMS|nr:hypothetical protein [Rickettsia montanensis]AFC73021.1 hypothetical protein MCI_00215 [Rickettsia montanensis str. OSU 85-930]
MTWNIINIPPQKQNIDTYPLLMKFLVGRGSFNIQNLEALKNANLENISYDVLESQMGGEDLGINNSL